MTEDRRGNAPAPAISRGDARRHMAVGIALVTVIPLLTVYYLSLLDAGRLSPWSVPLLAALVALFVLLGMSLLRRYPANIVRLRHYLEEMVNGRLPGKVTLLHGMDDISAIERSLNLIVEQLSTEVRRVEDELRRIAWLLNRHAVAPGLTEHGRIRKHPVQTLQAHAPGLLINETVSPEVLGDIMGDFLDLVETAAVVYERDGSVVLRRNVSTWCTLLEEARAQPPAGGAEAVEDAFWDDAAKPSIDAGHPIDALSRCGLRVFSTPVWSANRIVGAMAFAYGDPPRDEATLAALSVRYRVARENLHKAACAYETRPLFILSLARNRLLIAAKLTSEMIERTQAENILRKSEDELRRHRDHLEDRIHERTAELQSTNEQLQRQIEERQRAESLKDDFISTVSHELRTPLAITKEGINLLLDGIPGKINEQQLKVLNTARGNISRLERIINDLLDMSKIEAGKMEIVRERLDLRDTLAQAVAVFRETAAVKGLSLKLEVPDEPLVTYADAGRILQVLTNLVGNALKFTPRGSVTVSAHRRERNLECVVRDTGIGISAADMGKLFGKFVQLRRTDGAGTRGTGLGLAISKRVVELHGGRIWAESEPQRGARFAFALPLHDPQSVLQDEIARRLETAARDHKPLVLFLYEIVFPPQVGDATGQRVFDQGARRLVDERFSVRLSDYVAIRRPRQIVLLADAPRENVSQVCRRWQQVIEAVFGGSDEHLKPASRCGYAAFPQDAPTASELLTRAEADLTMNPHANAPPETQNAPPGTQT